MSCNTPIVLSELFLYIQTERGYPSQWPYSLSGGLLLVDAKGMQGRDGMMNRRKTIKMAVVPSDTKLQEIEREKHDD